MTIKAPNYPLTLLQIAGASPKPATLDEAVLVIVDAQNEYLNGKLPLAGIHAAIGEISKLLSSARNAGTPVIHVVHHSAPGRPVFDPETPFAEIISELRPIAGEPIVVKTLPNSFAGTALQKLLADITEKHGRRGVILTGFATHMCVSATARAALDLNIPVTIVAAATASRDLPNPLGGILPASTVHETALAELADRYATVVVDAASINLSP